MTGKAHCDDRRNRPRQAAAEKLTEDFGAYQQNAGVFDPSAVIACQPDSKRWLSLLELVHNICGVACCKLDG